MPKPNSWWDVGTSVVCSIVIVIIISIRVNRVNGFSALPVPKTSIGHAHSHLYGA